MKKIVLLMLVAMFATAQAEMLVNPGFEDGTYSPTGTPDGWTIWYGGYGGYTWHSTGGVGGGKAVQLYLTTSASYTQFIGQYVPVTAGEEYTFTAWVKNGVQGSTAVPYGYLTWFDSTGGIMTEMWLYPDISAGDDWAEVSFGSLVAPVGAESAAYWGCGYYNTIWDDMSMVPEPVTISLLGLGALMLRRRKKA